MAKKTSVQFYYEYIEQLQDLDNEQFRKVLEAMVKYDEMGEIIELDSVSKVAFKFIKKRMDYDKEKYNSICERNKENGKNGGRPKNPKEPKKPSGLFGNPEKPKKPDIDIELDLDIDKDIELDNNISTITTTDNNIFNYIESNFGRTLSPIEYEEISKWDDSELTRYAIKQAVLNGACSFRYIESILKSYKTKNIKTVQEAQKEEKRFKSKIQDKDGEREAWINAHR